MDDALKHLYQTELAHLRSHANEYARNQRYRDLARQLMLEPNAKLRDPFVDWVVDGYAFLAARVQMRLAEEFPRFTQNLLSVVQPNLIAPTPAMIIARFAMRPEPALMSGPVVSRGYELSLPLASEGRRTRSIRFTTGRQLRLFPIDVTEVKYLPDPASLDAEGVRGDAAAGIAVTLSLTVEAGLQDLASDHLDLHVSNADGLGARLFEALGLTNPSVEVHGTVRRRGSTSAPVPVEVAPLGFERERPTATGGIEKDMLLPYDSRAFDGYRLVHEFFALPDRFQFIRISGLDRAFRGKGENAAKLIFRLDRPFPGLAGKLGRESILTNCVPAVNLFEHQADDITMNLRQVEHQIVPDRGDPGGYEVHSIRSVIGRTDTGADQVFRPFFAVGGLGEPLGTDQRYYALNRVARQKPTNAEDRDRGMDIYRGSEVNISLVDDAALPVSPDLRALSIAVRCTNRHLPLLAREGDGRLQADTDLGWREIRVVAGPSDPRPGLPLGRALWDAVSHLSLNYLSLTETPGPEPAAPLRQLLRLYVPDSPPLAGEIVEALTNIRTSQEIQRIAPQQGASGRIAPVTFARGLRIELTLRDDPPETAILGAILDRFMAGYVSANTFTHTIIKRPNGVERLQWTAKSGTRMTL